MNKMKIVPSFVELPEDRDGNRIVDNPDYLLIKGRATREGVDASVDVSWLMPAAPGEFAEDADREAYQAAFESLKAAALFQHRARREDGTMEKGSVAKLGAVELVGDFSLGTRGTHRDEDTGNQVPDKYTKVHLDGALEIHLRPAPMTKISPDALAALKRLG